MVVILSLSGSGRLFGSWGSAYFGGSAPFGFGGHIIHGAPTDQPQVQRVSQTWQR